MKKFRHIIAIIEPKHMRQAALERALALVRATRNSKVTAVMAVDELSDANEEAQAEILNKQQKWLKAYLQVNAMGVEIDQRVISSKDVGKQITELAIELDASVIIKMSDPHSMLDKMFFTPLDWQLLRHASVPVFIAKENLWQQGKPIAIALDFSDPEDDEQRQVNVRLLREAQEVSHMTHSEIHILSAIPPMLPPSSMDLPGFTPDVLGEEALKEICRAVLEFAANHKIKADNCHIREGQVDEVIPSLCEEIKANVLFIGTSARKGLAVALLGNTCERVVDDLNCDVAVLTPKAIQRKVVKQD